MIGPLLEGLVAALVLLGVLSAVVSGAVLGLDRLLAIRARVLRDGLALLLREIRRENGHSFAPWESRRDAGRILAAAARSGRPRAPLISEAEPSMWQFAPAVEPERIGSISQEILPDFYDLGQKLADQVVTLGPGLRQRFRIRIRVATVALAAVVAAGLQIDALGLLAGLSEGLAVVPALPPPYPFWIGSPAPSLDSLAGVALTAVLLGFGAPLVFEAARRAARGGDGLAQAESAAPRVPPVPKRLTEHQGPIGEPGCAVRAVNFAGGGFDTLMQLGVTHALLVIKGRAPDAVVGVSAGAIQAAALAETLQAGGKHGPAAVSDPEAYDEILKRRVQRFRDFLYAARRAPESLIDALLPDTYDIDSRNPLRPLETPAFAREERAARLRELQTRSGLVRLYNRLLSVHIPIGTIARIVRRILGVRAASEIRASRDESGERSRFRDRLDRTLVQGLELFRVWLLVGDQLPRAVPLVRMLVPWRRRPARPSTAGQLIFRFRPLDRILSGLFSLAIFLVIVVVWVAVSWTIAALPFLAAHEWLGSPWWALLSPAALIILFLPGFQNLREYDHAGSRLGLFPMVGKGSAMFLWLLLKWSPLYIAVVYAVITVFSIVPDSGRLPFFLWVLERSNFGAFVLLALAIPIALGIRLRSRIRARSGLSSKGELRKRYLRWLLTSYGLHESVGSSRPLEHALVQLFDPTYYDDPDFAEVVDRSLADKLHREPPEDLDEGPDSDPTRRDRRRRERPRKVGEYADEGSGCRKIYLGLVAADIGSGRLEVMGPDTPIVDGLLAATAVVPIFRPRRIGKKLYVDGTNMRNVPMRGLMRLLRENVNESSTEALVYTVSPFPLIRRGKPKGRGTPTRYLDLIDIARRALALRRYQDANMERRLTQAYSWVLDPAQFVTVVEGRRYFRATVQPIELNEPADLWKRLLRGDEEERHTAIEEIIADGCRASLEVMVRGSLDPDLAEGETIRCAEAVRKHLEERSGGTQPAILAKLPGQDADLGPGLQEICDRCSLRRFAGGPIVRRQGLRIRDPSEAGPAWPHEGEGGADDPATDAPDPWLGLPEQEAPRDDNWPRKRCGEPGKDGDRPVTSLLLSGGVFRGVFQVGVLNALVELDLRPDLIAGASVGSITAAMAAQTFERDWAGRRRHVTRLAASYLAVDRLILTDRFADFVRNFTIRAAATDFSLRDVDRLFRRYDRPWGLAFDRSARRVIAGIERLLYVSPYQLNELAQTLRDRQGNTYQLLQDLAQQWLRRMDVGEEILGAESLEDLILNYVVAEKDRDEARHLPFDYFGSDATVLLGTTTNLTDGELEVLGEPGQTKGDDRPPMLLEGLLASSAFPGVFRPRWSWDLYPGAWKPEQYVDGGLMDNLPFEAAFRYLLGATRAGRILARPGTSHLMLAASLEPDVSDVRFEGGTWLDVLSRARQLSYNRKIQRYARTEEDLRLIYAKGAACKEPLDLEVMQVKPRWLPGTFGFHPMLGFHRHRQAESIAHGCATTLLTLAGARPEDRTEWGIDNRRVPKVSDFEAAWEEWDDYKREQRKQDWFWSEKKSDRCWLRPQRSCPFSRARLAAQKPPLKPGTVQELSQIHQLCPKKLTHARPA